MSKLLRLKFPSSCRLRSVPLATSPTELTMVMASSGNVKGGTGSTRTNGRVRTTATTAREIKGQEEEEHRLLGHQQNSLTRRKDASKSSPCSSSSLIGERLL